MHFKKVIKQGKDVGEAVRAFIKSLPKTKLPNIYKGG